MSDLPPPARLWRLVRGGLTAQAVHVAAELGIAGELEAGPLPLAELAERAGVDADALHRFLRALASEGCKWLDLLMLVLNRGRERTEPEWRALLDRTGFRVDRIGDLIEARCH